MGETGREDIPAIEPGPSAAGRASRRPWAVVFLGAGVALLLWARGLPGFVAWEVARDHERCFGRSQLPARLFSDDPEVVRQWLESRGTPVAPLPGRAGDLEIAGARYCPLQDRVAAHIYFVGEGPPVSVFVLSGPARVGDGWSGESDGLNVSLVRSAGRVLAVVGEREKAVEAVARALTTSLAWSLGASRSQQPPRLTRAGPGC
jgi:hypothetical protein